MTLPTPPGGGPATRTVLEEYHGALKARRRWRVGMLVATVALVAGTVIGLLWAMAGAFELITPPPWYLASSPLPIAVAWVFWKEDFADRLGRPGERPFPHQMLAIAAIADEAQAHPRPFGSVPPSMREHRHHQD